MGVASVRWGAIPTIEGGGIPTIEGGSNFVLGDFRSILGPVGGAASGMLVCLITCIVALVDMSVAAVWLPVATSTVPWNLP